MSNPLPATRVVTGESRLSFVHLFTPYVNPNSTDKTPKYSTTILIPKSDTATMQRIYAAINAAVAAGVPKVWATHPAQPQTPIWDGDGVRKSGEAFGPECKGHWVITASTKARYDANGTLLTEYAPKVVDIGRQPIINQSEVYSGMYAQVSMNFFAYSNSGNKGIGAGLGNVMKTRDGESLAGGKTAEEDFGSADNTAYQQYPAPTPQGYAPPAPPIQANYPLPQPGTPAYPAPVQAPMTYAPPAPQQYVPAPAPQQYAAPQQYVPDIDPMTGLPKA